MATNTDEKIKYIIEEQRLLVESINFLESGKRSGYRFLFLLVGAYFAYLSAPYKFLPVSSTEMAVVYAIVGIWASAMIFHHSDRFLHFLGIKVRRKTFFYRAISANRAWIFKDDMGYAGITVFPPRINFEEPRVRNLRERFAETIDYNASTTLFIFFLQALFTFGATYFISIFLRALEQKDFIANGQLVLFDAGYFKRTLVAFNFLIIGWIQFSGNECSHFQRMIWEARRITAERPNPQCLGKAFGESQPVLYKTFIVLMWVVFLYSLLGLLTLIPSFRNSGNLLMVHVLDLWVTFLVAAIFFAGKILFGIAQITAESRADLISSKTTIQNILKQESYIK